MSSDTDCLPSRAELAQILLLFDRRIKTLEKRVNELENRYGDDQEQKEVVMTEESCLMDGAGKKKYVYTKEDLVRFRGSIEVKSAKLSSVRDQDSPRYADVLMTTPACSVSRQEHKVTIGSNYGLIFSSSEKN
jgi:hypothetical protein